MQKTVYAFGNKPYCNALASALTPRGIETIYISDDHVPALKNACDPKDIVKKFEQLYTQSQQVLALANLGHGSVTRGVENVARAMELIKALHPELRDCKIFGPSSRGGRIFTHKKSMADMFKEIGARIPTTVSIRADLSAEDTPQILPAHFPWPAVLKTPELAGGRGMVLVKNEAELIKAVRNLRSEGHEEFVLLEYIDGLEVSFVVVRLGDVFLRMPPCYKESTSLDLKHPDNKVKMTGMFAYPNEVYRKIEEIMKRYELWGALSIETIARSRNGGYELFFIEGAARLNGNSPIEFGALKGFKFYELLAEWIDSGAIHVGFEQRFCVQYASYTHHGQQDVHKLLGKPWVLEAKLEDMGRLPYSKNKMSRIRVSFVAGNLQTLPERCSEIAAVFDSPQYAKDIQSIVAEYRRQHPAVWAAF